MKRRAKVFLLLLCVSVICAGCQEAKPIGKKEPTSKYTTMNSLTTLEYSIYMNKQLTVFASNITSRLAAIAKNINTDAELKSAKSSLHTLEETREETGYTYPSTDADEFREDTLSAMDDALNHFKDYIVTLENGQSTEKYQDLFTEDFNALTNLAGLYHE